MGLQDLRIVHGGADGLMKIPAKSGEAHRLLDVYIEDTAISAHDYMDIRVGTKDITRLFLKARKFTMGAEAPAIVEREGVFGLLRQLFGEDAYVEGDEDEDIVLSVKKFDDTARSIADKSVALYEIIPTGIDKTKLLRSACENNVLMPMSYWRISWSVATYSGLKPLDSVNQVKGLYEIKDGFVVPAGMELVLKTLIADVHWSASAYPSSKAIFHMKDKTFEFLSPIDLLGIDALNPRNITGFSLTTRSYFNAQDYVFEAGHVIKMEVDVAGGSTASGAAGIDTYAIYPIMLARKI
jgi:hypothetical protein